MMTMMIVGIVIVDYVDYVDGGVIVDQYSQHARRDKELEKTYKWNASLLSSRKLGQID